MAWSCASRSDRLLRATVKAAGPMSLIDDLLPLERAVILALLEGEDVIIRMMRAQLPFLHVTKRKELEPLSQVVCFDWREARPVDPEFPIGLVQMQASFPGFTGLAGFTLELLAGRMARLEGWSFLDPLPSDVTGMRVEGRTSMVLTRTDREQIRQRVVPGPRNIYAASDEPG
jgi:hypothetical protein